MFTHLAQKCSCFGNSFYWNTFFLFCCRFHWFISVCHSICSWFCLIFECTEFSLYFFLTRDSLQFISLLFTCRALFFVFFFIYLFYLVSCFHCFYLLLVISIILCKCLLSNRSQYFFSSFSFSFSFFIVRFIALCFPCIFFLSLSLFLPVLFVNNKSVFVCSSVCFVLFVIIFFMFSLLF